MAQGPLKGVKVVEFAGIGPGPFCCMLLSDMGADVVRIDRKNPRSFGKSLLAAGVIGVQGEFEKGDAVRIVISSGAEIARGIARYDAADAFKIRGMKSADVVNALGYASGAVIVHADDLVLMASA